MTIISRRLHRSRCRESTISIPLGQRGPQSLFEICYMKIAHFEGQWINDFVTKFHERLKCLKVQRVWKSASNHPEPGPADSNYAWNPLYIKLLFFFDTHYVRIFTILNSYAFSERTDASTILKYRTFVILQNFRAAIIIIVLDEYKRMIMNKCNGT